MTSSWYNSSKTKRNKICMHIGWDELYARYNSGANAIRFCIRDDFSTQSIYLYVDVIPKPRLIFQTRLKFWVKSLSITVTSREFHGGSNHGQLDCLFNSLFRVTTEKTSKLHITGPVWRESHVFRAVPCFLSHSYCSIVCWLSKQCYILPKIIGQRYILFWQMKFLRVKIFTVFTKNLTPDFIIIKEG